MFDYRGTNKDYWEKRSWKFQQDNIGRLCSRLPLSASKMFSSEPFLSVVLEVHFRWYWFINVTFTEISDKHLFSAILAEFTIMNTTETDTKEKNSAE